MKTLRVLSILLVLLTVGSGATPAREPDPPTPSAAGRPAARVVLDYWVAPYPRQTGWAIPVVREWNQKNPDIKVRLVQLPLNQLPENVLRQAIKDRKTPDICSHLFPTNVAEFVQMGGLLPLDGYPDLIDAIRRRSGDEAVRLFRHADGRLYQVPWKCNPIMLQYNQGLLASLKQPVPRTYTQFLQVGQALMAARKFPDFYVWAPIPTANWWDRFYDFYTLYVGASGGQPIVNGKGKASFQNAGGIAVMDFLSQSYRLGLSPRQVLYKNHDAQATAFSQGKLAFMVTGPWNIDVVRDLAGDTIKFDFAPIPVPDTWSGPVHTYGNFRNIGIFSTCKHPKEAARFIAFLLDKQNDVTLIAASLDLPYRHAFQTDPAFAPVLNANPMLKKFAEQMPYVHPVDSASNFNQVLSSLAEEFMTSAVKGQKTAADAVRDAAKKVNGE